MQKTAKTPRGQRLWQALVVALVIALSSAVPAAAPARSTPRHQRSMPPQARVPAGFVGMVVGEPLFPNTDPAINVAAQLDLMVASGVESIRVTLDWASSQPYRNWSAVPRADQSEFEHDGVDGVPTRFAAIDQLVGMAAQRGLTVLPTVLDAPRWDGEFHKGAVVAIPKSDAPYANFVKALVRRYGPHGSFWQDRTPKVPIRMWQIWNEPNIAAFWPVQPFVSRYVALLRAAHAAIKAADPGATVVLGGMPNFSWVELAKVYKMRGTRRLFDVVAAHPYTQAPQGVITILTKLRHVMNVAGDTRKPILADELSWPSSLGKTYHNTGYTFATTESGQASKVGQMLPMLASNRVRLRLLGFYYYTWESTEHRNGLAFDFSGLLRFSHGQFVKKPAFFSFRHSALGLEHCAQKALVATRCPKP